MNVDDLLASIDEETKVDNSAEVGVVEVPSTKLETFITEREIKGDVSINTVDLDDELITHPSKYIHYAIKTTQARKQYDSLKNKLEILEASLDTKYREQFLEEGKKATETMIKSAITTDKQYVELSNLVIEAKCIYSLCEVAENAFEQRKDLLLEVARDRRKEKEGQLRVLSGQQAKDNVTEMLKRA